MDDCPTIPELAAYVEGTGAPPEVLSHVPGCSACRASLDTLQGEVQSLQISISELWFRERVSCPRDALLQAYQEGSLGAEERKYVEFHVEDLECPYCQGILGDLQVSGDRVEVKRRSRSREKVGEATTSLLRILRKGS